jgi:hypothetical protein
MQSEVGPCFPRALPPREEAVWFPIEADFPGAVELRQQAEHANVVGDWDNCCASIAS